MSDEEKKKNDETLRQSVGCALAILSLACLVVGLIVLIKFLFFNGSEAEGIAGAILVVGCMIREVLTVPSNSG